MSTSERTPQNLANLKLDPRARIRWTSANLWRDRYLWLIVAPGLIYFLIFHYIPMYGNVMAFQDFNPGRGFFRSRWVGFENFVFFFESRFAWRLIRNTIVISVYTIVFGFPVPIIFALLLNEVRTGRFKKIVQTVSYLPRFISTVVVVGMLISFFNPTNGVVNELLVSVLGRGEPINFFTTARWFRPLFVGSEIWENFGWSSIIYLAALTSIDPELHESAEIDGASRFQRVIYINIPGISNTIIILLILSLGRIMSVGFEKIILMYNPAVYETADVISTYVYRRGIIGADFSFATAVGLFNALVNLALLVTFNWVSRRVSEVSLF